MDSAMAGAGAGAGAGGSRDEGTQNWENRKRPYFRLNSAETKILEKFFTTCHYPNGAQRGELAAQVGLNSDQVKFWFQNKRSQFKARCAREYHNALRMENERIKNENLVYEEALKKMICTVCRGPPVPQQEHEFIMQKLKLENALLKDEFKRKTDSLQMLPQHGSNIHIGESSHDPAALATLLNQGVGGSSSPGMTPFMGGDGGASLHNNPMGENLEFQAHQAKMIEIADSAKKELARLLYSDEVLWVLSPTDGKLTLNLENYERIFPKDNHLVGPNVRVETSKHSATLDITGMELVETFLDPVKWVNTFPTIVARAKTIKVFDNGLQNNRDGALLLMHEETHVLSPLVQPREFHFLRCCENIDDGLWVITDVSVDPFEENNPHYRSWKHPSGWMIHEMPDGRCMVTCIEHVEVEEMQPHPLFRNLIETKIAYGAERWTNELHRTCDRVACFSIEDHDPRGVICSMEGKRSVMMLAHRMVNMFCESLTMSGHELNYLYTPTVENTSEVKFSVYQSTGLGHPNGVVVVAATTLWFPLHYQKVFEFFTDIAKRPQWDVFGAANEVAHIATGTNSGNKISLFKPLSTPMLEKGVMLQECFMDPMGSYVVYAPTDAENMEVALTGGDELTVPVLPSGFVISSDGQRNDESSGGSLLTVAFQILVSCSTAPDAIQKLDMKRIADVNTLLDSTVKKIQSALL